MGNSDVGTVGPGARHTNPAPIFSATQRALVRHRPPVTTMSAPSRAVMKDREMASSSNCFFHAATIRYFHHLEQLPVSKHLLNVGLLNDSRLVAFDATPREPHFID